MHQHAKAELIRWIRMYGNDGIVKLIAYAIRCDEKKVNEYSKTKLQSFLKVIRTPHLEVEAIPICYKIYVLGNARRVQLHGNAL